MAEHPLLLEVNALEGSVSLPTASRNTIPRLAFLDYLRVYAFLAVLLWHKFPQPLIHSAHLTWLECAYNAALSQLWYGMTGVFVFFLVSGYIITHVILRETAPEFLIKRIFRIYPLFLAAVFAQYGLMNHTLPPWQGLTLFGDFSGTPNVLWGVDWSLRIEIVFYGFIAATRFLIPQAKLPTALPIIAAVAAIGCYFGPRFPTWNPLGAGTFNAFFPLLLLGSCIYLRQAFPRNVLPIIVGIALLFDTINIMPAVIIFMAAWRFRSALMEKRSITFLADMSYSVYLFHFWFYDFVGWHMKNWPAVPFIALSIIGLFVTCYFVMIVIERPMIKVGRRAARLLLFRPPNWRGKPLIEIQPLRT